MRKTILSLTCLAALTGGIALADDAVVTIDGFANPESVAIDGSRRFVSNLGAKLDPLAYDGDGFISELDETGRVIALRAFPAEGGGKLNAPKGMAVLGGRLYVTDIDRIVGFDLASRATVFEARVPAGGATLLNDLVLMEGSLVASDTLRGEIYRIDTKTAQMSSLASGIPGANGMAWDANGRRLLVVGVGAGFEGGDLFELPAGEQARKLPNGPHGLLDGVGVLPDGRILVSDWRSFGEPVSGALTIHAADGARLARAGADLDLHGPADFAVDAQASAIWLPLMPQGKVIVIPFGK